MTELKELQIALHCMKFEAEIEVCEECSEYETCTDLTRKDVARACISALEKQIPQKPKDYVAFDGIKRKGCPTCDHNEILYVGQKYCSVCGQAIDWGDSDE